MNNHLFSQILEQRINFGVKTQVDFCSTPFFLLRLILFSIIWLIVPPYEAQHFVSMNNPDCS